MSEEKRSGTYSKLESGSEVTYLDIERLKPGQWLNDNIIVFYFELIELRVKESAYPSVYVFCTFFYTSLSTNGIGGVLSWNSKIPNKTVFDFDILFVPLHFVNHWALCVIDNRKRIMQYYDSIEITDPESKMQVLELIKSYLVVEADAKLKSEIDPATYKLEIVYDIPRQTNFSDCGMFLLRYAECISRDVTISFNQSHMEEFRKQMLIELYEQKIKPFNADEAPLEQ